VVLLISDIRLKNYGSEMIEVNDNGCGVDESNFHALSMLQLFHKLMKMITLTPVAISRSLQ